MRGRCAVIPEGDVRAEALFILLTPFFQTLEFPTLLTLVPHMARAGRHGLLPIGIVLLVEVRLDVLQETWGRRVHMSVFRTCWHVTPKVPERNYSVFQSSADDVLDFSEVIVSILSRLVCAAVVVYFEFPKRAEVVFVLRAAFLQAGVVLRLTASL